MDPSGDEGTSNQSPIIKAPNTKTLNNSPNSHSGMICSLSSSWLCPSISTACAWACSIRCSTCRRLRRLPTRSLVSWTSIGSRYCSPRVEADSSCNWSDCSFWLRAVNFSWARSTCCWAVCRASICGRKLFQILLRDFPQRRRFTGQPQ